MGTLEETRHKAWSWALMAPMHTLKEAGVDFDPEVRTLKAIQGDAQSGDALEVTRTCGHPHYAMYYDSSCAVQRPTGMSSAYVRELVAFSLLAEVTPLQVQHHWQLLVSPVCCPHPVLLSRPCKLQTSAQTCNQVSILCRDFAERPEGLCHISQGSHGHRQRNRPHHSHTARSVHETPDRPQQRQQSRPGGRRRLKGWFGRSSCQL